MQPTVLDDSNKIICHSCKFVEWLYRMLLEPRGKNGAKRCAALRYSIHSPRDIMDNYKEERQSE